MKKRTLVIFGLVLCSMALYNLSDSLDFPVVPQAEVPVMEEPQAREYFVFVTGAVRKPGLYAFKSEVRVAEAVHAAGDPLPYADMSGVNYAEVISDGLHVHVPYNLEGVPAVTEDGVVNINDADEKKLGELPGVGPSMAKTIMDYRSEHGPFAAPEDLQKVKGIGPAKWNKLKDKVSV